MPGLKLEVYGTLNCEYFYKPDIYDVAGTLPVGRYEAVAQSVGCYGGFTWVTLRYKNAVYSLTKALLIEGYRDIDTTSKGEGHAAALSTQIDTLWRDVRWSIRDIQDESRGLAELV